jgi:predicted type IV restriction endonuclease
MVNIKIVNQTDMSFLKDLFSSGANTLVDSVGKVLDNVVTTKEEKMQLDNEIRKSEMQFQVDMKKLSNEEQRMILDDMSSARQREVQVQTSEHATKLAKNVSPFLALGTTLITLALFYVLIFSPQAVKGDSKDIIMYILGVLSAVLTQIYSYYFGSSAGSAEKSRIMTGMQNKP